MGRQVADATVRSAAPREVVWEVLADGSRYWEWGPWEETTIEREGAPPPNGVGAIRRLLMGRYRVREQVTAFEKPSRLSYLVLSGMPLDDYRSTVELTSFHGGTEIRWRSEFGVKVPLTGGMARKRMTRLLDEVATAMAREAERRAAGPPA